MYFQILTDYNMAVIEISAANFSRMLSDVEKLNDFVLLQQIYLYHNIYFGTSVGFGNE